MDKPPLLVSILYTICSRQESSFSKKEKGEIGLDFPENCVIILFVPNGGIAQLVRAHASHA
jgi:hypothetical protein